MALRFCDSMAHYSGSGIIEKWTSQSFTNWNAAGGNGRRGAPYLSGALNVSKTLTHQNNYIQGAAIALNTSGAGGRHLAFGNDSTQMAAIQVESDGTVSLFANGSRLATSARAVADYTSWHYYEISAIVSGGTGPVTLTSTIRVDGLTFTTFTGTIPGVSGTNLIDGSASINACGVNASSPSMWFMDFYCIDTATSDQYGNATTNTAFLGDVEIDALFPAQDVITNWGSAGGDGTHAYTCVNANPINYSTDTSYVITSNTSATAEQFRYQPITGFTGTILGAQYLVLARKDAEGIRIIDMTVGTHTASTIEFQGTSNYLSDYYVYYIAPLDSDFGSAWGTGNFGTATTAEKFGFECIG